MFRVSVSNQVELLAEVFCAQLASPLDIFAAEHVIVPSAAVRVWLEQSIARQFGIAANLEFAFPAQWIWRLIAQTTGTTSDVSPLAKERLIWRILSWLQRPELSAMPRLGNYLRQADPCMQFELAGRIAAVMDRYGSYRPHWLSAWARGETPSELASASGVDDASWQAACWRHIVRDTGIAAEHPSHAFFAALRAAGADVYAKYDLPARVALFAVPALPPLYLDIFRRLGDWIDVTVYAINPCAEYWLDLASPKQQAKRAQREQSNLAAEAAASDGNMLLAHWGQQCKANLELLLDRVEAGFADEYVTPGSTSLLARLQKAILQFEDLPAGSVTPDHSIVIHSAHSLTRELEILHDQLLHRFHDDPSLEPGDVLVVTPDLDAAASVIDGVFGSIAEQDTRCIPYRIAGISARSANAFWRSFIALMQLAQGRWEVSTLVELLEFPPLARRFGLSQEGLEAIRRWLAETGVHWGLHADHARSVLNLDEAGHGTLDAGLRRLFIGYVMPTEGKSDFLGCLPYDDVEGSHGEVLAGIWRYAQCLDDWHRDLTKQRSITEWQEVLSNALQNFYAPSGDELSDYAELATTLQELVQLAAENGADYLDVPCEVICMALEQTLANRAPGGTPSGAVTFAPISALRSVPYRLICCLGMNHDAYPALRQGNEFDLLTVVPRKGDPDRRNDERNVVLDLLLAARDAFYISYTGRALRDNTILPPSILVADLLDELATAVSPANCSAHEFEQTRRALVIEHPLQAFSPRYFVGDQHARSFRHEYCEALTAGSRRQIEQPFFEQHLPQPSEDWRNLNLEQLACFFRHPIRFLLQARLDLHFGLHAEDLPDEEPFCLDRERRGKLQRDLLASIEQGLDRTEVQRLARLRPEVAAGTGGIIDVEDALAAASQFHQRLCALRGLAAATSYQHELVLGEFKLSINLTEIRPHCQLHWQFSRCNARFRLEAWIKHLALCASDVCDVLIPTQCLTPDETFHFVPVENAKTCLLDLLELYWEGLQRPLSFFPFTAWEYMASKEKLEVASRKWTGTQRDIWYESEDPCYRLVFRERYPDVLDEDFRTLAKRVYEPVLAALKEGAHADGV